MAAIEETRSQSSRFSFVRVIKALLVVICLALAVGLVPLLGDWMPWRLVSSSAPVELAHGVTFVIKKIKGPVETELHLLFFDARRCDLRIVEQPERESAHTIESAAASSGALAACNGGYFDTRSFQPSGLQVTAGVGKGELIREPLWGCVYVRSGNLEMRSLDEFKEAAGITDFLECTPMLIMDGRESRLEGATRNRRTFIMTDGAGRWAFGTCRNIGLQELASVLGTRGIIPKWLSNKPSTLMAAPPQACAAEMA